jgi:hypothetical protein
MKKIFSSTAFLVGAPPVLYLLLIAVWSNLASYIYGWNNVPETIKLVMVIIFNCLPIFSGVNIVRRREVPRLFLPSQKGWYAVLMGYMVIILFVVSDAVCVYNILLMEGR